MGGDTIAMVLLAMRIGGLWNPRDWNAPWKNIAYDVYARLLDCLQFTFSLLKIIHTYYCKDYAHSSAFLESLFESLYLLFVFLQRFLIRRGVEKLRAIIAKLDRLNDFSNDSQFYTPYEKQGKRIHYFFGVGAFAIILDWIVKDVIGAKEDLAGEAYWKKTNPKRILFVEVWLPFDETVSPYYEIILSLNIVAMVNSLLAFYIFCSLIPVFSIRICYHFRTLANMLEHNLIVSQKCVSILMSTNEELIQKRDLRSLILYHQEILKIIPILNSLLRVIVLLKIVFLTFPILTGALTLTQSPVGSPHFMRYLMLMVFPLLDLFLFCWYAEQISTHGFLIHKAAYFCPWYQLDMRQRKSLLLMSTVALRPVCLKTFSCFTPVNLDTFIGVIQMCYSAYLMLLRLTETSRMKM